MQGRAGHLQQSHHALDVRSAPALLFSVAGEGGADQLGGRGSGLLLTLLAGLAAVLIRVKDQTGMAGRVRVPMGPALIAGTLLALWL